jgi:hypothetical protein
MGVKLAYLDCTNCQSLENEKEAFARVLIFGTELQNTSVEVLFTGCSRIRIADPINCI